MILLIEKFVIAMKVIQKIFTNCLINHSFCLFKQK